MKAKPWVQGALAISFFGAIFSGGLSYRELFLGAVKCPAPGAPGTVLGYPACVYGFVMFTVLVVVCALALRAIGKEPGGR